LSIADVQRAPNAVLLTLIAFMYFGFGMFISASYALFMSVTDHRLAGTQFSLFMAATNGCEVWAGAVGGQIAERASYAWAFVFMSVVSLVALPLLWLLKRNEREQNNSVPEKWR
jgi:MFS family permease